MLDHGVFLFSCPKLAGHNLQLGASNVHQRSEDPVMRRFWLVFGCFFAENEDIVTFVISSG